MKLYVAGPMTGLPEFNRPAFFAAADVLTAFGFEVVNPARHEPDSALGWADYMRLGLADVLGVDGVAVLDGWLSSRGAWLEVTVARALEVPVKPVVDWLIEAGAFPFQDAGDRS